MPLTAEMFAGNWSGSLNPSPGRSASPATRPSKTLPDTRRVTKFGLKRNRAGFVNGFTNENSAQNFSGRVAVRSGGVAAGRFRGARYSSHSDGRSREKLPNHPGKSHLGPIPEG